MKPGESTKESALPSRIAYTTTEVAGLLGLSKRHVEHLVIRGRLPSVKIGRNRRVRHEALDRYLRELEEDEAS